jgi:hypothetical protein
MGSDANASLYMTKYVNVNISIRGNRFLTFYFPLDPVIISLYFSTVRYSMAPDPDLMEPLTESNLIFELTVNNKCTVYSSSVLQW